MTTSKKLHVPYSDASPGHRNGVNDSILPSRVLHSPKSAARLIQLALNGPKSNRERTLIQKLIREHNAIAEREELRRRLAPKIDNLIQESTAFEVLGLLAESDVDDISSRIRRGDFNLNAISATGNGDPLTTNPSSTGFKSVQRDVVDVESVNTEIVVKKERLSPPSLNADRGLPMLAAEPETIVAAEPSKMCPERDSLSSVEPVNFDYMVTSNRLLEITIENEEIKGQLQVIDRQIAKCLEMRISLLRRQQAMDAERLALVTVPNVPTLNVTPQNPNIPKETTSHGVDLSDLQRYIVPTKTTTTKAKPRTRKPVNSPSKSKEKAVKKDRSKPASKKRKSTTEGKKPSAKKTSKTTSPGKRKPKVTSSQKQKPKEASSREQKPKGAVESKKKPAQLMSLEQTATVIPVVPEIPSPVTAKLPQPGFFQSQAKKPDAEPAAAAAAAKTEADKPSHRSIFGVEVSLPKPLFQLQNHLQYSFPSSPSLLPSISKPSVSTPIKQVTLRISRSQCQNPMPTNSPYDPKSVTQEKNNDAAKRKLPLITIDDDDPTKKIKADPPMTNSICLDSKPKRVYFNGHMSSITALKVCHNNVLSCSKDGTIRRYTPFRDEKLVNGILQLDCNHEYVHQSANVVGLEVLITKTTSLVIVGIKEGFLKKFLINEKYPLTTVTVKAVITCLTLRWNTLFVGTTEGTVLRFCATKLLFQAGLPCADLPISCLGTAMEGACRILVVGSLGGDLHTRDALTGLFNRWLKLRTNRHPTSLIVIHNRVYTHAAKDGANCEIYIHDMGKGELLHVIEDVKGISTFYASVNDYYNVYFTSGNGFVYRYPCGGSGGQPIQMECGLTEGAPSALLLHKNMIIVGSNEGRLEALLYEDKKQIQQT